MSLAFSTTWIDPISVDAEGIVVGKNNAFGIGTLLVLKCRNTNRVLMGRKSFREGFEGSNQFTFPGGMLRSEGALDFNACIQRTLRERVSAEAGVSIHALEHLVALDHWPPIVGRYTIKGDRLVSTSILPFYGEVETQLPASSNDSTVHAVTWYDPLEVMHEVTQTNALILAQALWTKWSIAEQQQIKPVLMPHFEAVSENAESVGATLPEPPWGS